MNSIMRSGLLPLIARLLIVAEFVVAVIGKITDWSGQAAYMTASGLRYVTLPLAAALVIEFLGSLCLVLGFRARLAAAILFVYLAIVSVTLHNFWSMSGNAADANQTEFFKNLGIMGGLLMIALHGPGAWTIRRVAQLHR